MADFLAMYGPLCRRFGDTGWTLGHESRGLRVRVRTVALDLRRMSDNRDTQNTAEERGAALTLSTHMTEPARDDKSRQCKNPLIHAISTTRFQNSTEFGGEVRSVAIASDTSAVFAQRKEMRNPN